MILYRINLNDVTLNDSCELEDEYGYGFNGKICC